MVNWQLVYIDGKWNKKAVRLANEYNSLVKKKKVKKIESVLNTIADAIIEEKDTQIRRDFAFLMQQVEDRHPESIFPDYVQDVMEYLLKGPGDEDALEFMEFGNEQGEKAAVQEEQFNIETIDLAQVGMINVEIIGTDKLEKTTQKCAFGDGEILDENGECDCTIWRCKGCKTVYHENCLRVCLLMKGSCQICDVSFLPGEEKGN